MTHEIITYNVSRETFEHIEKLYALNNDTFEKYIEKLFWWNKRINLFSRSLGKKDLKNHICHSLLLKTISSFSSNTIYIDAGTGGGLPGIPLAITNPSARFILNDSNHKKMIAIQEIIKELKINNIKTESCSIDDIKNPEEHFSIISKHAFKINDLIKRSAKLNWGSIFLLKGYPFENELIGIKQTLKIDFFKLDSENDDPFYMNKCLLSINSK